IGVKGKRKRHSCLSSAPALWSRTGPSSCGICRVLRLEPCREGISLRLGQMQVMLGSAQQYVISRAGPFVCHEIADFRFIEQPAMVPAQAVKIGSRPYKVARTGAVQSAIVMDKCAWHPRPGLAQAIGESFIVSVRHVAAGQRRAFRPVFAHARENVLQPVQATLGQFAKGSDLAAKDIEQRRAPCLVEIEYIVARHGRRIALAVVEQWPDRKSVV